MRLLTIKQFNQYYYNKDQQCYERKTTNNNNTSAVSRLLLHMLLQRQLNHLENIRSIIRDIESNNSLKISII